MEMARCLLFEKEMPKAFCAKAINTAIFPAKLVTNKGFKVKNTF